MQAPQQQQAAAQVMPEMTDGLFGNWFVPGLTRAPDMALLYL